jgi:hypothetical protein
VRAVERSEVGATRLVERVAGHAEALPETGFHVLVEARTAALVGLPLVQELTHPGATGLPLDLLFGLSADLLGLGDERLTLGGRRKFGGRPSHRVGLAAHDDGSVDLVELTVQGGEIADDTGLDDLSAQLAHGVGGLLGRHLRVSDPLLQQVQAGGEFVVLAPEVGQGVGVRDAGVGPHLALAVCGLDEDNTVGADASKGRRCRGAGATCEQGRRRGGRGSGCGCRFCVSRGGNLLGLGYLINNLDSDVLDDRFDDVLVDVLDDRFDGGGLPRKRPRQQPRQ